MSEPYYSKRAMRLRLCGQHFAFRKGTCRRSWGHDGKCSPKVLTPA